MPMFKIILKNLQIKKQLLILLILATVSIINGQSNLEFNQTLNLNLNNAYTVPDGKTWKITSASANQINIDGGIWKTVQPYGSIGAASNLPIWVSEGQTISRGNISADTNLRISVLEFNIVSVSSSSTGNTSSNVGVSADGFSTSGVFNVVLEGVAGNGSISNVFGTIEVPEGKIWKIINVSAFKPGLVGVYSWIIISGNMANFRSDQVHITNWNLYLSEGTHSIYCQSSNNNHGIEQVTLNGIEYNAN